MTEKILREVRVRWSGGECKSRDRALLARSRRNPGTSLISQYRFNEKKQNTPQTHISARKKKSAKSESEGTMQFNTEARKMVIIIARRWRWTWDGVPMATWRSEWICRICWGLVHHIVNIPHTLSLLPLRGAAVGRAPTILPMDRFCTRLIGRFSKSQSFSARVSKAGWGFSERTCIFGGIQFTRHFIEFVVVGKKKRKPNKLLVSIPTCFVLPQRATVV